MIKLITDYPVAIESPDHLMPWGTARDNSVNKKFNKKLIKLLDKNIKVLDLGCAGGGFVRSLLKQGIFAVGIEGSDYSKKLGRAEWKKIPENLFTADITKPFEIDFNAHNFDVITMWEVIEHIAMKDLDQLFINIRRHLSENGLVIGSISTKSDVINGLELHQNIQSRSWWLNWFKMNGWYYRDDIMAYFMPDWVRGTGVDDIYSFNFVLEIV